MVEAIDLKAEILKLQNLVVERYKIISIALVIITLLSAMSLVYLIAVPSYVEQDYIISSYTSEGTYSYKCPVNDSNPLYPTGTVLPAGQPAYFLSVSPVVNMGFTYGITASDSADVAASRKTIVRVSSSGNLEGEEQVFWQKDFSLMNVDDVTLGNGDTTSHNFSIDVSDFQALVKDIQDDLQYSQEANITVITYVDLRGNVNGKEVNEILQYPVSLRISESYYQISSKLESNNTMETYATHKVKDPFNVSRIFMPLVVLAVAAVSLIAVRSLKSRGIIDQDEIHQLEQKEALSKFEQWISEGQMPDEHDLLEIRLTSLQGLVDAASDMDARVIYDSMKDIYFAIHDGAIYTYYGSENRNGYHEF